MMERAYFAIAADIREEYRPNIPPILPPSFNQLVAALTVRIVYRTGHRHHLPPHLRRQLGSNQRTGFQRGLDH